MYGYASSTAEAQDGMCGRATPNVLGAVGAGSAFDLSPQRPLRARRDENSITLCRKKGPSDGRRLRVLGGCSSPVSQLGVRLEPGRSKPSVTPQSLIGGLAFARVAVQLLSGVLIYPTPNPPPYAHRLSRTPGHADGSTSLCGIWETGRCTASPPSRPGPPRSFR